MVFFNVILNGSVEFIGKNIMLMKRVRYIFYLFKWIIWEIGFMNFWNCLRKSDID